MALKITTMKIKQFLLITLTISITLIAYSQNEEDQNQWKSPSQDILDVLYAPQLPWVWTSPTGKHLVMADPIYYPELAELAGPMHKLAGYRVNPKNNYFHGNHGGTSPRIVEIKSGKEISLNFPEKIELEDVSWTSNGERFALMVNHHDHIGLWVGDVSGEVRKVDNVKLNGLLGYAVDWTPDQKKLIIKNIPDRGAAPKEPEIPIGPMIMEGEGANARSTYEARNLLETAYDEQLFEYYMTSEIAIYDPTKDDLKVIGGAGVYRTCSFSPDGKYILIRRLKAPWSHEVAWWRYAHDVEVWDMNGKKVSTIASIPLSDQVPVHGVPLGVRSIGWRPTAPSSLFWFEALDGGDPAAEAEHRDKLMSLSAPFNGEPKEVFKAQHRLRGKSWGEGGLLMLTERERIKRWRYYWLLDVDKNTSNKWFDIDEGDRYNSPGYPEFRKMENGFWVMRQKDNAIYFKGSGGTEKGDRPFLDLIYINSDKTERLFRCDSNRYEYMVEMVGDDSFILRSESATEVPNYYMATFGEKIKAEKGEAVYAVTKTPITQFKDPTPSIRQIEKRLVKYEREDGVQLSFQLHLPPGYKEGTKLPTVLYAYPLEYSGASTAGQVRGSSKRFMRIYGPSHLYFLLKGYAVLDRTAMPMIGDPETTYDSFVEQLNMDAEAAVKKAVEMGITDKDRVGVIGHSHGGLMVANLLAHTDLFAAGIARSGSYNKTNQPFGFQSERRSLFEAREAYIKLSPTFYADKVNEPVLIIHGNDDSNPGTLTFQSEVFYEAVRGSGGTARLVLLPYEDHGYRAKESIEHVLWEQLEWFDKFVKEGKLSK